MELYKTDLGTVLHPDIYSGNALYGRNAMELVSECEEVESLIILSSAPINLHEDVSVRRSNRVHLVGCLALLEIEYRFDLDYMLEDTTHEKIITSAVKVFKKDLPMRARMIKNLYYRAVAELNMDDGITIGR